MMAITAVLTAVLGVGFSTPALAEGESMYQPEQAMLTKVIVAPAGTVASGDEYVFHFAGGGQVTGINTESGDKLFSDGVEQDTSALKVGDTVPTIDDVTLQGVALTDENSLSNGQSSQVVVQKSIADILDGVEFPHAGVYTYVVTEKSATTALTNGTYINASKAEYILRIRVKNTKTGGQSQSNNKELTIEGVTVEQTKDDDGNDGNDTTGKVNPTYPTVTGVNKIYEIAAGKIPDAGKLAGDGRGCNVAGFTFANQYVKGGAFQVKKLYDGAYSDRTKYTLVELVIYSAAAAMSDQHGMVVTYRIEGEGIDTTENNQDSDGEHTKLNGIYDDKVTQVSDYMQRFDDSGWCYIKADLKEGSSIRITGEFGPYDATYADQAPNGKDRRETLSTTGLLQGQTFYVIERYPGDYAPTGYVYVGGDASADPRIDQTNMTKTEKLTSDMVDETSIPGPEYDNNPDAFERRMLKAGSLFVKGSATGGATTVFVVNAIDESNVIPTGIFIDNLPYILMVGIPVAVFAVMFVIKHRENAAA